MTKAGRQRGRAAPGVRARKDMIARRHACARNVFILYPPKYCHFERSEKSSPREPPLPHVISSEARNLFSPPTPHCGCHFERSEKSSPISLSPHKISPHCVRRNDKVTVYLHCVRRNDRVTCRGCFRGVIPDAVYPVPSKILSFRAKREIFTSQYPPRLMSFRAQREIFSPHLHLTPSVISSEARNLFPYHYPPIRFLLTAFVEMTSHCAPSLRSSK